MVDFIADYFQHIETFPVQSQVQPGYLKKLLPESAPRKQESFQKVLDDINTKLMPGITHWQSLSFFGYYPANTSMASILEESLTASISVLGFTELDHFPRSHRTGSHRPGLAGPAPHSAPPLPVVQRKGRRGNSGFGMRGVVRDDVSSPEASLDAGRHGAGDLEAEALAKLTVYTSDQAHCSVDKISQLAGINAAYIRKIPTDASTDSAMSPALLACTIQAD